MENELIELGKKYTEIYLKKYEKKQELDTIEEELQIIKESLIQKMMEDGVPNFTIDNVGRLSLKKDPYLKVINPEFLIEKMDSNNLGYMAPRKVDIRTLTSWYKDQENQETFREVNNQSFEQIFDGIIDFSMKPTISFTGKKMNRKEEE